MLSKKPGVVCNKLYLALTLRKAFGVVGHRSLMSGQERMPAADMRLEEWRSAVDVGSLAAAFVVERDSQNGGFEGYEIDFDGLKWRVGAKVEVSSQQPRCKSAGSELAEIETIALGVRN